MTRTYVVTQPVRGTRTLVIEAESAADAVDRAWDGEGEAVDTNLAVTGRGHARWERPRGGEGSVSCAKCRHPESAHSADDGALAPCSEDDCRCSGFQGSAS